MFFFLKFLLIFFFFSFSSSSFPSFYYNNLTWILTPSSINHFTACQINHLFPTSFNQTIPWNSQIMSKIITGFNLNLTNDGIKGCCVPGLWCSKSQCFTQSFETNFINYHSTHSIDLFTVFTCQTKQIDKKVIVEDLQVINQKVQISGNNFGIIESNIEGIIGSTPCTNIENCHTVCQSCEGTPCQKDNACVLVGSSYSCLMFCSGPSDTSCPCGTICQHVNVYTTQNNYIATHFCAPKGLSCDNYLPSKINQFECETPRIYNWVNDSFNNIANDQNVFDVVVSVVNTEQNDLPSNIDMQSCSLTSQCTDYSPYTSDTCHEGKCLYQLIDNIGSISPFIRERNTAFTYIMFASNNMTTEHDLFESRVRLDGDLLPISNVDDVPEQFLKFGFTLNYFGNSVHDIAVNPNGLVSFPPFVSCSALAGTLFVSILYSFFFS